MFVRIAIAATNQPTPRVGADVCAMKRDGHPTDGAGGFS